MPEQQQSKTAPPEKAPASPAPAAPSQGAASPQQQQQQQKKKVRKDTPIHKFYEVKGDKVNRLRRECPRCGRGVFLAEHKDRLTCGKCGYTSYRKGTK